MSKRCLSSTETIQLLLKKLPMKLSIQELGEISGLHRNTVRSVLKHLNEQNGVNQTGDLRTRNYYHDTYGDWFRRISAASKSSNIAKSIGYNLVHENIATILGNECPNPGLKNDTELLSKFISITYPFIEINYSDEGKPSVSTEITVTETSPSNSRFVVRISKCLCSGDPKHNLSCSLVSGGISAIFDYVFDSNSMVKKHSSFKNESSQYCEFEVKLKGLLKHNEEIKATIQPNLDEI